MKAHEPRQHHAHENGNECQAIVLLPNHFVIEAENVLADEAFWRSMYMRWLDCFFHMFTPSFGLYRPAERTYRAFHQRTIVPLLCPLATSQTRPAAVRSNTLSCCSDPVRRVACRQFHTCPSLLR